jgi:hypothetical protein
MNFSTDPQFLVKQLRCDGCSRKEFTLEQTLYSNGTEDYCHECFHIIPADKRKGVTSCTARQRCEEYAQEQANYLLGMLGMASSTFAR